MERKRQGKKTTLMLEEGLYASARKVAAAEGKSVSSVVAEAMRVYMADLSDAPAKRVRLTAASGGGWIGPVDPVSNADLLGPLDDEDMSRNR